MKFLTTLDRCISRDFAIRMICRFYRWVLTVSLVIVAITLLSYLAEPWFSNTFPIPAWRYGTATMQADAAPILCERIKTGMTFQEVLQIIGPGSDDWPEVKTYKLAPEQVVGFNVRADYNTGIDVHFLNGRVAAVFFYD